MGKSIFGQVLSPPNPKPTPQPTLQFPDANPRQADGAYDISSQFHNFGEDVDKTGPGSPSRQAGSVSQEGLDIAIGENN